MKKSVQQLTLTLMMTVAAWDYTSVQVMAGEDEDVLGNISLLIKKVNQRHGEEDKHQNAVRTRICSAFDLSPEQYASKKYEDPFTESTLGEVDEILEVARIILRGKKPDISELSFMLNILRTSFKTGEGEEIARSYNLLSKNKSFSMALFCFLRQVPAGEREEVARAVSLLVDDKTKSSEKADLIEEMNGVQTGKREKIARAIQPFQVQASIKRVFVKHLASLSDDDIADVMKAAFLFYSISGQDESKTIGIIHPLANTVPFGAREEVASAVATFNNPQFERIQKDRDFGPLVQGFAKVRKGEREKVAQLVLHQRVDDIKASELREMIEQFAQLSSETLDALLMLSNRVAPTNFAFKLGEVEFSGFTEEAKKIGYSQNNGMRVYIDNGSSCLPSVNTLRFREGQIFSLNFDFESREGNLYLGFFNKDGQILEKIPLTVGQHHIEYLVSKDQEFGCDLITDTPDLHFAIRRRKVRICAPIKSAHPTGEADRVITARHNPFHFNEGFTIDGSGEWLSINAPAKGVARLWLYQNGALGDAKEGHKKQPIRLEEGDELTVTVNIPKLTGSLELALVLDIFKEVGKKIISKAGQHTVKFKAGPGGALVTPDIVCKNNATSFSLGEVQFKVEPTNKRAE